MVPQKHDRRPGTMKATCTIPYLAAAQHCRHPWQFRQEFGHVALLCLAGDPAHAWCADCSTGGTLLGRISDQSTWACFFSAVGATVALTANSGRLPGLRRRRSQHHRQDAAHTELAQLYIGSSRHIMADIVPCTLICTLQATSFMPGLNNSNRPS